MSSEGKGAETSVNTANAPQQTVRGPAQALLPVVVALVGVCVVVALFFAGLLPAAALVGGVLAGGGAGYAVARRTSAQSSALPVNKKTDTSAALELTPTLLTLIGSLHEAVVCCDADGRVRVINDNASMLFGQSSMDSVGQPLAELGLPWDRETLTAALQQVCRSQQRVELPQCHCECGKETRSVHSALYPVLASQAGDVRGIVLLARDLTALQQLQKQLQLRTDELAHAGKLASLGELTAGLAHEINQPLNAIKIGGELLYGQLQHTDTLDTATVREVLEEIVTQAKRCSELTEHVQAFSRRQTSGEPMEGAAQCTCERVDVNHTLQQAVKMIRHQLRLHEIDVTFDCADSLAPVLADPIRLEQVFVNLAVNARDALDECGPTRDEAGKDKRLTLTTRQEGDAVVVTVSDNGTGIDPDAQARVFEPFYTTKDVGKGTGLGLAISRETVLRYGGEITVTSEPGQGTTFELRFPHADAAAAEQRPRTDTARNPYAIRADH